MTALETPIKKGVIQSQGLKEDILRVEILAH